MNEDKILTVLEELRKTQGNFTPAQQSYYDNYLASKNTPSPMQELQNRYNMPLDSTVISNGLDNKYNALINQYTQAKKNVQQQTDENAQSLYGDYYQRIKSQQRNNVRKSALSGIQMANDILMNLQAQQTSTSMYNQSNKMQKDIDTQIANAKAQKQQEVSDIYDKRNMFLNQQLQQEEYNNWSRNLQMLDSLSSLASAGIIPSEMVQDFYNQNIVKDTEQNQLDTLLQQLEEAKKKKAVKNKDARKVADAFSKFREFTGYLGDKTADTIQFTEKVTDSTLGNPTNPLYGLYEWLKNK